MMRDLKKIKFKIYGLSHERKGAVRADVFARKLDILIRGLKAADKHLHGKKSLNYLITDLKQSSALAEIDEVQASSRVAPMKSSVLLYQNTITQIAKGGKISNETPIPLITEIAEIGNKSDETFSHAEISIDDDHDNIIRIDEHFNKHAGRILKQRIEVQNSDEIFSGASYGTFDGVLKEVDLRGTVARAKLILGAGKVELDCICNSVTVDNLREALNLNVSVSALAYYSEESRLPERIDIKKINVIGDGDGLGRWRGQFNIPAQHLQDIW